MNPPHTKPDGTLTPWGAQQQLGLLVKDPVGNICQVTNVNNFGDCTVSYKDKEPNTWPCRTLRRYSVPLTPETAYVGQWVREIARPYLIGEVRRLHGQWGKDDGDETYYAKIVGMSFDEFEADIAEYEALPLHCQTVNPNLKT